MSQEIGCAAKVDWHLCDSLNCFIDWLDHWQTMLTGIGAVGAAAASIYYLRKQISNAAIEETARRSRRFTAARARLPLLLSDTIQYANDAMDLLKRYLDATEGADDAREALASEPRPVLPDATILSFETIIEITEDDEFANVIADMIS